MQAQWKAVSCGAARAVTLILCACAQCLCAHLLFLNYANILLFLFFCFGFGDFITRLFSAILFRNCHWLTELMYRLLCIGLMLVMAFTTAPTLTVSHIFPHPLHFFLFTRAQ